MTDQAPPPAEPPAATPAPPAAPAPAPAPAAPAATAAAMGLVAADVPNRAIAYIIDAIMIFVVMVVVAIPLAVLSLGGLLYSLVFGIIGLLIGAAYFIYLWTTQRATVGMRLLGMQVGNAGDGATLTMDQAIRRWLAISAPSIVAQAFAGVAIIGFVLALASLAWFIFLVYTTAQSPTKQGWHDKFVNSQVVKAARTV